MSETVKPLPQDHIEGIRTALAAGGPFFEMLEPKYIRETLARVMANLEKAERDLAQLRKAAADFIEAVGAEVSGPSQKALAALIAPPTSLGAK